MYVKTILIAGTLGAILVLVASCATPPMPTPTRQPTFAPTMAPAPVVTALPAIPTPTREIPTLDESTCRDACHEPDPNASLGAGAKPRPADHAGYTTCLTCHASPPTPALPATHLGRLDEACNVCHLEK